MANIVFKNCYLSINGVNLSGKGVEISLPEGVKALENTAFGADTETFEPGLFEVGFSATLNQDHAVGSVDDTINAAKGLAVTVEVRPVNAAPSATNPKRSGSMFWTNYDSIPAKVGELGRVKVDFKPAGSLTRAIA